MSDTPSRMPWEEFERRVESAVGRAIMGPDEDPSEREQVSAELSALLGWPLGEDLAAVLRHPPYVCGCGALYRSALPEPMCHQCAERAKLAEMEARIEARVRAELAQKGDF